MSNFDYAPMLTEEILLGNVAIRAGQSTKFHWDGPNRCVTNVSTATARAGNCQRVRKKGGSTLVPC